MDDIQNVHETQICLQLIHEAYSVMAKRKGLIPCPLYHQFKVGNQIVQTINTEFIEAINKYMLVNGFNDGIKPLNLVQEVHQKIINDK